MSCFRAYLLPTSVSVLLMFMLVGCWYAPEDKSCLENKSIYDTLSHHGYTYYAGREYDCPVLMRAWEGHCNYMEYIRLPICWGAGDLFYNHLVASGDRIAVNYYVGNGDSQNADSFLLSTDDGVNWNSIDIEGLAEVDEGIWKLILHGTSEIELFLFDPDGRGHFWSKDNGETWVVAP